MAKTPSPQVRFGEVIRAERVRLGWSQDELAHRAGLNRVYMGEIERGEKIVSLESIVKLAAALKTKAAELLAKAEI